MFGYQICSTTQCFDEKKALKLLFDQKSDFKFLHVFHFVGTHGSLFFTRVWHLVSLRRQEFPLLSTALILLAQTLLFCSLMLVNGVDLATRSMENCIASHWLLNTAALIAVFHTESRIKNCCVLIGMMDDGQTALVSETALTKKVVIIS